MGETVPCLLNYLALTLDKHKQQTGIQTWPMQAQNRWVEASTVRLRCTAKVPPENGIAPHMTPQKLSRSGGRTPLPWVGSQLGRRPVRTPISALKPCEP